MKKGLKKIMIVSMVAILGMFGCGNGSGHSNGNDNTDRQSNSQNRAYEFQLETLKGKTITLDDYKGKVLILNIWDTWCPPCRAEIPDFIELYDEYQNKNVEILGVAAGRNGKNAVVDFVKEYKINYPIAIGSSDIFQGFGGVRSIPTTFIIDKKGNIVEKIVGLRPKEMFENKINSLI
jgi:cytochrome c biogenesis protein CcmG/thiol:disulfide interchange protein DsbE